MEYQQIKTLKKKVEYCLNKYPNTRNSDITLMITIWKEFHDISNQINLEQLYSLPREDNIKRIRSTFQSNRKYLPTEKEVAIKRGLYEENWRVYLGYNPEMKQVCLL